MTRKYERELKEVERLQLENRELKSRVRQLERRVKKLNKGYNQLDELTEDAEYKDFKEIVIDVKSKLCYECNIGILEYVDLESRYYRQCSNCPRRTRSKLK